MTEPSGSEPASPVRLVYENAEEFPPTGQRAEPQAPADGGEAPPPAPRGGRRTTVNDGSELEWPEACPITPLGIQGDLIYVLDVNRQLRALDGTKLGKGSVRSLFGHEQGWLKTYRPWCDWDWQLGVAKRVKPELVADALVQACSARGVWDVFGRVRGRGGWRAPDGELVLHLGDRLVVSMPPLPAERLGRRPVPHGELRIVPTGVHDRYVYPTGPSLLGPADVPEPAGDMGVGEELLAILQTWSWARPSLDPHLLAGWIACANLGGAIAWRPLAWVSGGAGTGKSTLHEWMKGIMGQSIIGVSDATAASIWGRLGYDSLPIAFDELEAESDNRRGERVVQLARQAASGGSIMRSSSNHEVREFTAHSAFLFSSINMLSLRPQDISRMAILDLRKLAAGSIPPQLTERQMRHMGARLKRRLLDQWPRFDATLALYRQALQEVGHSARGAEQFGALLAGADLLLGDCLPTSEECAHWASLLKAATLSEVNEGVSEHQMCLNHVLGWLDPFNRERRTLGRLLMDWGDEREEPGTRAHRAEQLEAYGVKPITTAHGRFVGIANTGPIGRVFDGTHWQAISGGQGVWIRALRRIDGAVVSGSDEAELVGLTSPSYSFAGVKSRCTWLPWTAIFDAPPAPFDAAHDVTE